MYIDFAQSFVDCEDLGVEQPDHAQCTDKGDEQPQWLVQWMGGDIGGGPTSSMMASSPS
jgi:hypothetical protein